MVRIALLILVVVTFAGCSRRDAARDAGPVSVRLGRAEERDIPLLVEAQATLYPKRQARVTAQITAPIRDTLVQKGEFVETGDPLALLDDRDLLAERESDLATLQNARAELQRTQSSLAYAEGERSRTDARGSLPSRNLLASEGTQPNIRERDVRAAQERVRSAQAALDAINAKLQYARVLSPFDGTITDQLQFAGDMASSSAPIFILMDLSTVTARAKVPVDEAAKLRAGQACIFESARGSVSGRLTSPSRAVDPERRTVETSCEIPNAISRLQAGLFGMLTIDTGLKQRAVMIPASALHTGRDGRSSVVYVVDDNRVAHRRDVQAGMKVGGDVQVRTGLKPGETVVTDPGNRIKDGTLTKPQ